MHTSHAKHTVLDLFNVYSNNVQFNHSGQESRKQFAVYDSYIHVTLKYGQGHQTWFELLDLQARL